MSARKAGGKKKKKEVVEEPVVVSSDEEEDEKVEDKIESSDEDEEENFNEGGEEDEDFEECESDAESDNDEESFADTASLDDSLGGDDESLPESVSLDGGVFADWGETDGGSSVGTSTSQSSALTANPFLERNREKRRQKFIALKKEQRKQKIKERRQRQKQRKEHGDESVDVPKAVTLDNQREKEDTMVSINDQEVLLEERDDEFAEYFDQKKTPKVLLTTSDRPRKFTMRFIKELQECIPNSHSFYRRALALKKVIPQCVARGFTDLVVVVQDRKKPTGLLLCHLPHGPTAHFKLTNVKVRKEIKNASNPSEHCPEIILNNFGTRLGHRIGRMFSALYPHDPEFRGRQVVTFHNQRDFVFFRHHRYVIRAEGKKAHLQELGPRFTLKLRSLQKGTFDSKFGEYEWIHKRREMDKSRRKFHL